MGVRDFVTALEAYDSIYQSPQYYGRTIPIIQSSATGKSRLVSELRHVVSGHTAVRRCRELTRCFDPLRFLQFLSAYANRTFSAANRTQNRGGHLEISQHTASFVTRCITYVAFNPVQHPVFQRPSFADREKSCAWHFWEHCSMLSQIKLNVMAPHRVSRITPPRGN
jgi:hypothetical protein